jgi:predicted ATP-grasp superfamily ATP-dependent carboligase
MLAAQRALHAAGMEVTAVGIGRSAPGIWSRTASRRVVGPDPASSPQAFVDVLLETARAHVHDVLLPGTDIALVLVSRHRDLFEPHVRLGLPNDQIVLEALDRSRLEDEARRVGLPPPESRLCADADEAAAAAEAFGYPVLIKPVNTVVDGDGSEVRWGSEFARNAAAVRRAAQRFGLSIVQRWVDATVISFGGVVTCDGLLAHVVSRYLRTWPTHVGSACLSETIVAPSELVRRVEELARALQWEGIFELELLWLPTGEFEAIDFNPRAYGSMALANAAGVPLAAIWCRWLMGESTAAPVAQPGVRYRWGDADYRSLFAQLRNGASVSSVLRARSRGPVAHAFVAASDPLPGVARLVQMGQLAAERRRARRRAG